MKSYVVKSKWPLISSFNDRREIITDFKAIRQAENLQAAKERLAAFSAKWESSYKRRIKNLVQMEDLFTFFSFPTAIRQTIVQ